MKKCMLIAVIGCLLLMTALAEAQVDKLFDRFLQRGEPSIQPKDLKVVQLEVYPDPIREGQRIRFRVSIENDSSRSGRVDLIIKDRDDRIVEMKDINIRPGDNRIDFPETNYRLSRSEHCFTVELNIGQTRQRIDEAKEFCARRTRGGWTLRETGIGNLSVEDLDMYPDPAVPGQGVWFSVKLRNEGRPFRGTVRIQDKDQVVVQIEDVQISRGLSDVRFPHTKYSFQRFDQCFTVIVDFERNPYPVDAAREFCAKPTGWTLKP